MTRVGENEIWLDAICAHLDLDSAIVQHSGNGITHLFLGVVEGEDWIESVRYESSREVVADLLVGKAREHFPDEPDCCLGSSVVPGGYWVDVLATCGDCHGGSEGYEPSDYTPAQREHDQRARLAEAGIR